MILILCFPVSRKGGGFLFWVSKYTYGGWNISWHIGARKMCDIRVREDRIGEREQIKG